jgi:8-oxo-dGTP pyrophosphatase MutT (NUDIX family)
MEEDYYKMEKRIMYCNNCGKRGHAFKDCIDPIISYGIMLIDNPTLPVINSPKLLMVRRKDSMAFTEFLRGKYNPEDSTYVTNLMSNMTKSELALLKTYTFDELWTFHWGVGQDHHSREFDTSKDKFIQLNIPELSKDLVGYDESEWGFPKGRRTPRETDIECAVREFSEETNIPRTSYVICNNLLLSETFVGTNGIPYRHDYFVAVLRDPESIDLSQALTNLQRREVSAIEWKTIQECRELTRPHYIQRSRLIDSFERLIHTFDLQDNIAINQK